MSNMGKSYPINELYMRIRFRWDIEKGRYARYAYHNFVLEF